MFDSLFGMTKEVGKGIELERVFLTESLEDVRRQLSIPDMRPGVFDMTVNGWLARIGEWGRVRVEYYDPDLRRKRKISNREFEKLLTDESFIKAFGKWDVDSLALNKVVISRQYVGLDGKKKKEKFFVEIELKKELAKAVK